jgi:hypothetical protein
MRFSAARFRPAFGRVLSIVIVAIVASGIVGLIATNDWSGLVHYAWGLLLIGSLAVALFLLPYLDVAESEITVRNVFSTTHVPWNSIERIDTKYALTLYTNRGTIAVWASPAPSRYAGQVSAHRDVTLAATDQGGSIRPGDLLSSASGAAAFVIRQHWNELRDDGLLDAPGSANTGYRREVHWVTIGVLGALAIATALGILL